MQEKEPETQGNNSEQDGNRPSTSMEIKNLKAELENIKASMAELQTDYSELQREYEKLSHKQKTVSGWSSGWRKIKNSFHSRPEADETGERQQRPNSISHQLGYRRRVSVS